MTLKDYLSRINGLPTKGFKTTAFEDAVFSENPLNISTFRLLQSLFAREDEADYQIILPDKNLFDGQVTEVLFMLCLIKFKENDVPAERRFSASSRWFHPRKNREFEALGGNVFRAVERKSDETNEKRELTPRLQQELVKLTDGNEPQRRIAKQLLQDYFNWYATYFPLELPCLTRFNRRILVVGSHKMMDKYPYLPIQYNGDRCLLPIEPLIHVVSDWAAAKELLATNTHFEDLVITNSKGSGFENEILNTKIEHENLKRVIFLHSETVAADNLMTWHWTTDELFHLKEEPLTSFERLSVNDASLKNVFEQLENWEKCLDTEGVALRYLRQSTRRLFAVFCRKTYFKQEENRADNLPVFFDAVFYEIETLLRNVGKTTDEIEVERRQLVAIWQFAFASVQSSFNPKREAILDLARQARDSKRRLVVVTDRQEGAFLNTLFENKGLDSRSEAVTVGEFVKRLAEEKWVFDAQNPSLATPFNRVTFVFPYIFSKYDEPLFYFQTYLKAARRGSRAVLLHYDFETSRLDMFEKFNKYDILRRLTSSHRFAWLGIEYVDETENTPLSIEAQKEEKEAFAMLEKVSKKQSKDRLDIANYFARFGFMDDFSKQNEAELTEIAGHKMPSLSRVDDRERWKITFQEGGEMTVGNRAILVKMPQKPVEITGLRANDRIVYFDIDLKNCRAALREIPEARAILKRIDEAKMTWHRCLQNIQEYGKRKEKGKSSDLKTDMSLSVSTDQIDKWLVGNSEMFPRSIEDLRKILMKYQRIKPTFSQAEIDEIMMCQNQAASLREVVTKLNIELTRKISGDTEGYTFLTHTSKSNLDILLKTKSARTIKTIEKICLTNNNQETILATVSSAT